MPRAKRPETEHHQSVAISFEPNQYKQLIEYCERNDRTMAWVIRQALKVWLERHKNDSIED